MTTMTPEERALEVLRDAIENPCQDELVSKRVVAKWPSFSQASHIVNVGMVSSDWKTVCSHWDISDDIRWWLTTTKAAHLDAKAPAAIIEALRALQETDAEAWAAATGAGAW